MVRRSLIIVALLSLLGGCDPGRSVDGTRDQSSLPDSWSRRMSGQVVDTLEELTAAAAWKGDSAFCDSVLERYADTALARTNRDLTVALFFNAVMAHKAFQYGTMAKLAALAEAVDNETLRLLHQYLTGRHRQIIGDPQGALRIFLPLLPKYSAMGDSGGIASTAKRIGFIHAMDLDQPAEAIPYLRRALNVEWVVEDRCDIALFLGRCFTRSGVPDSVEHYAAFLDDVVRTGTCRPQPGPRPVGYRDQLRFNALALRAGTKLVSIDSVRKMFHRAIDAYPLVNGALPGTEYIDPHTHLDLYLRFAQSLLHAGRSSEAQQALAYTDSALRTCQDREGLGVDLYRTLVAFHRARGDATSALKYQDLRIAAMERSGLQGRRRDMERIEATTEFEREQAAFATARATEQAAAQAVLQRERTRRNIFLFAGLGLLVFGAVVFRQRNSIRKEHQRSEELLLNILPVEVAQELKAKGHADAKHFDSATILFTDFKGFTEASEKLSPQELVEELNTCFKAFDNIITARGIEKIKTIGDAYMCAGGLPDPKTSSPADVVHAALEMQAFMTSRKAERDAQGLPAFEMRLGIHTGPVVAGIVGVKKFQYDIWGDTVNTASRMESSGEVGEVNISEATYALVKLQSPASAGDVNGEWSIANGGSTHSPTPLHHSPSPPQGTSHSPFTNSHSPAFTFTPRGKVQAKGKGEMEMYFVEHFAVASP
ncbi:MAG: adenylate/guanylate cyclase domain-containing protein [Flavobacteriales bacterium]